MQNKKVEIPTYWRKKKLNPELESQLQETAKKESVLTDKHGEYKDGVFLYGCAIVVITITNDLWSLEIHSESPIGLPMIKEIRYKYLPDAFLMAQLLPSREEKSNDRNVVLYQIPGSFTNEEVKE